MEFVVLFMVVFLLMIFLKMKSQVDGINVLNKLLYIEKQPEKYIQRINKVISKKQTPKNLIINTIQKTTGLFYAGRF
ncbi:MAG: hypothetical protein ACERLG_12180, partial [Sedimentibacter sp.]